MRFQAAILCTLLALLFPRTIKAADTNSQGGIRTKFVADAVLKPEELAAVVDLAKSCGMGQVASIESFHYLPSIIHGILVTSIEHTNGRKVTFSTVEVFREGWAYKPKPADLAKGRSSGQFWVDAQQSPTIHELTMFSTPQGTIRVELSSGIRLDVADRIIKAFTTGRIKYSDESTNRSSKRADFFRPDWLGRSDSVNTYEITFSGGLNRYRFTLAGETVEIVSVIFVDI